MTNESRPTKPPKPTILFQDDEIAVVNKPTAVWPREGVFDEPGVFDLFANPDDDDATLPIQVTPMDYDVSGCVLYAFSDDAAKNLCEQFAAGRATIQYDCVVNGPLLETTGEIEADVPTAGDDAGIYERLLTGQTGKPRTAWRAIDTFVAFARIECTPNIPSDLQVRVHLQHGGIALAVDKRHGGATQLMLSSFKAGYRRSRRHEERPLIQRPSMHAKTVAFGHPMCDEKLTFEADHGKDYRALLHQLDRFGRVPK